MPRRDLAAIALIVEGSIIEFVLSVGE